jgi:hypothetical protein
VRPPKRDTTEFERIPKYGEPIKGKIVDIAYDKEHKSMWEGKERIRFCIRFKFELEGCQFPHYSRWLTFSYGEKATLFKKYIKPLVEGAQPDMDLDIDILKGMDIKTIWSSDGEYDNLELIMALGSKVRPHPLDQDPPPDAVGAPPEEDVPF